MRVIIAHNNSKFRDAIQSFLQPRGFPTAVAKDGIECASLVRTFCPDFVALDATLLWGGADGIVALMQDDLQPCSAEVMILDPSRQLDADSKCQRSRGHEEPLRPIDLAKRIMSLAARRQSSRRILNIGDIGDGDVRLTWNREAALN